MVSLKTNIAAEKQIREKSFFLPYSITDFLKNCNKKTLLSLYSGEKKSNLIRSQQSDTPDPITL